MKVTDQPAEYSLYLAYQLPKSNRLQRLAASKPREKDIFIAYALEDIKFAEKLDQVLRNKGFDPWVNLNTIPADGGLDSLSEDDLREVKAGIRSADVFIFLLSEDSSPHSSLRDQLAFALKLNKLIILISSSHQRLKSLSLGVRLDNLVNLDLHASSDAQIFHAAVQNIIHLQTYIRLQARSMFWDRQGRILQHLLTVDDLNMVKQQKLWIETHELGAHFQFTEVQQAFLSAMDIALQQSESLRKSQSNIFISYSRKDQKFVRYLSQEIKNNDWRIWVDWENIPIATDWRQEVEEGIRAAHT
ncbi:MAG: toll/interleukin-1 receptor domain-containing protein, partial [Cyanobacteria bacterium P01_A01_bin.137]